MQVQYNKYNLAFGSHFYSNKAFKEVKLLAKQTGQLEKLNIALNRIKYINNYKINLVHKYSKTQDVCKSEFKYDKNGQKEVYTAIENRIKNPAEASLNWILALADRDSKIFKKIMG